MVLRNLIYSIVFLSLCSGQQLKGKKNFEFTVPITVKSTSGVHFSELTEPNKEPNSLEEFYSTLHPLPTPKGNECPKEFVCVQRVQCFHQFSIGVVIDSTQTCYLPHKEFGVCCPVSNNQDLILYIDDDKLEESEVKLARNYLQNVDRVYQERLVMWSLKQGYLPHSGQEPQPTSKSVIYDKAQIDVIKNFGLEQAAYLYSYLWNSPLNVSCHPPIKCYYSPYRTLDGTCNNLKHPNWGSVNSNYNRRLLPHYSDGINSPRLAKDGHPLPSPRYLSLTLSHPNQDRPQYSLSHVVTPFGQFISHDIAATPSEVDGIDCCSDRRHPYCIPITIPKGDRLLNGSCLNAVRSRASRQENCHINSYREQVNGVTSYIDASPLYGNDDTLGGKLRLYEYGMLQISSLHDQEYMPFANESKNCGNVKKGIRCFFSGDDRSNQNHGIVVMHTIWLREHNKIARALSRLNPHWDDETLFQESRKIVIAEIQHITYNEYLPVILDLTTRKKHGLVLKPIGSSHDYLPNMKSNVMNEFATAAYRMGHSMINNYLPLIRNDYYVNTIKLDETFFNPHIFYKKYSLDMLIEGYISESAQMVDKYYASGLTEGLFKSVSHGRKGSDLLSINIQRGRDHGIAGYNEWRKLCGLKQARDFHELEDVISRENVEYLKQIYSSVEDIDLYVAGILEQHVVGSIMGPTFTCIVADQFRRLKQGDRFWYERADRKDLIGFSTDQLQEIRKVTLARVLCENTHISLVQPLVFVKPGPNNPKVSCNGGQIPQKNLIPWLHLG